MTSWLAKLKRTVPQPVKGILVRWYRAMRRSRPYRALVHRPLTRDRILEYWKSPWDGRNAPEDYLRGTEKSELLLRLVRQVANNYVSVLEIGCNVGRNLYHLFSAGYTNLTGIEINEEAVRLLRAAFPDMAGQIVVHNAPAETVLPGMAADTFDLVFTMAVLEHIHRDSEWLFGDIARVTKEYLITIEDEEHISWRHFPRNYRKVFERLGLREIHSEDCSDIPGLGPGFVARVFRKSTTAAG